MARNDPLKNGTRNKIYQTIMKNPGIHLRKLSRKIQIPTTTLNYHLDYLQKRGYLVRKSDANFIRYYVAQNIGLRDKEMLHIFRQNVTREIIVHLILSKSSTKRKMIAVMKRHPATIDSHLKKLIELKIVERGIIFGKMQYRLTNPEAVCEFLIKHRESLSDHGINRILNQVEYTTLLETKDPKCMGQKLAAMSIDIRGIVKQGARGCTLIKNQGESVRTIPSVTLQDIGMKVVNTVGCGDAFIGAFAAAKVKRCSDEEALIQANYAGAYKATQEETRGSPTHTELKNFITKTRKTREKRAS